MLRMPKSRPQLLLRVKDNINIAFVRTLGEKQILFRVEIELTTLATWAGALPSELP